MHQARCRLLLVRSARPQMGFLNAQDTLPEACPHKTIERLQALRCQRFFITGVLPSFNLGLH